MKRRISAALLSLCLLMSLMPSVAFAAPNGSFDDVDGHWGQAAVERWAGYGVVNGDGSGNFNPDNQMTRAEFATMLANMLGYKEKAANTFADVNEDDWFADAILKLAAAGVMQGSNGMANPNAPITRQEAAVLMCRAFNIPTTGGNLDFADSGDVADWAKGAVAALADRGMMNGVGNNNVAPLADINRASVATLLDNMITEYVTEDKTITGEVSGIVLVAADATVTVEDATLNENLIVAPKADGAEVALTGTTTASDVVVGATATVKVESTASAGTVQMEAANSTVEVAGKADAVVVAESAEGAKANVTETAEVKDVTVAAPNAETQVAGKVETVAVAPTAEGAKANVTETAEVKDVTVAAPKAETQVAGKVETVAVAPTAEGAKANVAANAEVKDMTVAAPNAETSISGTVSNVAVADTATGANVTANAGAKVDSVTTSAENVTVNGAKDTIANVSATGGSADVKADGAEVKNDGADKVTVDGNKDVANGDSTTSTSTGTATSGGSSSGGTTTEKADLVVAPLADHADSNAITSGLGTVIVDNNKTGENTYDVRVTGTSIMNHANADKTPGHWVGFGMPAKEGGGNYDYYVGTTAGNVSKVDSIGTRTYPTGGKTYNTVYFSFATPAEYVPQTIVVKDGDTVVATYNVTFNVTFYQPKVEVSLTVPSSHPDYSTANTHMLNQAAIATLSGYNITLSGALDTSKLVTYTPENGTEAKYAYYFLKSTDSNIKKLSVTGEENPSANWANGEAIATKVMVGDTLQKVTHTFTAKDANNREQGTVTVTVDSTGCTVSGKNSVVFKADGIAVETRLVDSNGTVGTLPTVPAKAGYTGKWMYNGTEFEGSTTVSGNMDVVAGYTPIEYTLTYDLNTVGGTAPTGGTVTVESTGLKAAAAVTAAGKNFLGWAFDNGAKTADYAAGAAMTASDLIAKASSTTITLYAIWEDVPAATFEAMDGTIFAVYSAEGSAFKTDIPNSLDKFFTGELKFQPDATTATKIKVTGTLNEVKGWTGFNGKDTNEQSGYYLPLMFAAPDGITTSSTITIKSVNGSRNKTFGADVLDKGTGDKLYFSCFLYVDVENNTPKSQTRTFAIDWDGNSGTAYTETIYTLDLSSVTLKAAAASPTA